MGRAFHRRNHADPRLGYFCGSLGAAEHGYREGGDGQTARGPKAKVVFSELWGDR